MTIRLKQFQQKKKVRSKAEKVEARIRDMSTYGKNGSAVKVQLLNSGALLATGFIAGVFTAIIEPGINKNIFTPVKLYKSLID